MPTNGPVRATSSVHPLRARGRVGSIGRVALTVCFLVPTGTISGAQVLPTEPISLGGGRLVVSGEASAAIAAEDPSFYNYTDYEQNTLRLLRLGCRLASRWARRRQS